MDAHTYAAKKVISMVPLIQRNLVAPLESRVRKILPPLSLYVLKFVTDQYREGGQRRTMTEIAAHLKLSKQHTTQVVDKLIDIGLVARENNPRDRRVVNIVPTRAGARRLEEIGEKVAGLIAEQFCMISEEEAQTLAKALDTIYEIFKDK